MSWSLGRRKMTVEKFKIPILYFFSPFLLNNLSAGTWSYLELKTASLQTRSGKPVKAHLNEFSQYWNKLELLSNFFSSYLRTQGAQASLRATRLLIALLSFLTILPLPYPGLNILLSNQWHMKLQLTSLRSGDPIPVHKRGIQLPCKELTREPLCYLL